MGLDLLDITFRIEREIGVKLKVDELLRIARDGDVTVGDLYTHLLRRLHLRDVGRYDLSMNLALWRELQGVVHHVTGVPLEQVELGTRLATLFPRPTRREAWESLREACPYHVRELDYPPIVRTVGFLLAAAMVAVDQLHIWQIPGARWVWPLLGLLGLWMLVETYAKVLSFLAPFRTRFPSSMVTVKDLCRAVLATNYDAICREAELPLDERSLELWQRLTGILVDTLGIDADEVTFHARLLKDLGAD